MTDENMPLPTKPAGYAALGNHIAELRTQGICPTCQDIHNSGVFVNQVTVFEDDPMRIVLDQFPRAHGQTIVVWKAPHLDFTTLAPEDTATLFTRCTEVAHAIKQGLGAEKFYLITMCDGFPNLCMSNCCHGVRVNRSAPNASSAPDVHWMTANRSQTAFARH